jgi:hypothetical protein
MYDIIEVNKYNSLHELVDTWVGKDDTGVYEYDWAYDKLLYDINKGIFAYLLGVNPALDSFESYIYTVHISFLYGVNVSEVPIEDHTGKFYTDFVNQKFKN